MSYCSYVHMIVYDRTTVPMIIYDTINELHRIDCKAFEWRPPYVTSLIVFLLLHCLTLSYKSMLKKLVYQRKNFHRIVDMKKEDCYTYINKR